MQKASIFRMSKCALTVKARAKLVPSSRGQLQALWRHHERFCCSVGTGLRSPLNVSSSSSIDTSNSVGLMPGGRPRSRPTRQCCRYSPWGMLERARADAGRKTSNKPDIRHRSWSKSLKKALSRLKPPLIRSSSTRSQGGEHAYALQSPATAAGKQIKKRSAIKTAERPL